MEQTVFGLNSQALKRWFLGLLSISGFVIFFVDWLDDGSSEIMSQICLRLGIVLGSLWLAFPQVEQMFNSFSAGILIVVLLVTIVVVKNPIILLVVITLCLLLGIMNYFLRVFKSE